MIPVSTNLWVEHLKGSACRRHSDAKDRQLLGRRVHRWPARTPQQNVGQRERLASQRSGREHIDDERDVDRAAPHRDVRSDSQVIGPCRADSLERPVHLEMFEPRDEPGDVVAVRPAAELSPSTFRILEREFSSR
jgi:hypothetical protein